MKKKKRPKTARLALVLTAMVMLPIGAFAQDGLFDRGVSDEDYYGFGGTKEFPSLLGNRNVGATGIIDNQVFGQETPLGSGILVLLATGMGYAALKRKEEEQ